MSNLRFSKKIAYRYLWSKRSEAFISIITIVSVLGVAIGVMVLNIVMAVMTGFEHELKRKIVDADSHIVLRSTSGPMLDWRKIIELTQQIPGVESASAFSYHQVLLTADSGSVGLLAKGITEGSATAKMIESMSSAEALRSLFDPAANISAQESEQNLPPSILIGRELVRTLAIGPKSLVSLVSTEVGASPFGMVPRYKRFMVVGSYHSGLIEYESGVAYIALSEAQKFFRMGDSVTGIEYRVRDIDQAAEIGRQIMSKLGGITTGFYVQNWQDRNSPLWEAIRLEKRVYFIVLLLIIVMASFSIVTTLVMIVIEKRKDIAIMKTIGASTPAIGRIFRIQGSVIGVLGTALGLVLGYLGCLALRHYGFPLDERVFQMSTVPVQIEWLNFAIVGAAAILICFVATWYPARRASALHPSEVLRYE